MKSLRRLFLISLSITFVLTYSSCSTDDGDLTPNQNLNQAANNSDPNQLISNNSIVGDWELSSLDYAGSSSNAGFTTNFSAIGKDFTYVLILKDNPKTYTTSGGYTVELTSTFDGTSFTQDVPSGDVITSGTWELNGNVLTTTDDATNQVSTADILSSANNNIFSLDFAGYAGRSVQGADVKFTSGQMTFERQ